MTMPEAEAIPFEPQDLRGERLLVLAPHPDDEVIGCGGLVALHLRERRKVHVVIATDGAQAGDAAQRESESRAALASLGDATIEFLRFPDRKLADARELDDRISAILREWKPDLIAVPSPLEIHPDHVALSRAFCDLIARDASLFAELGVARVAFYEVSAPPRPNALVDITSVADVKYAAIAMHASQSAMRDYTSYARGLNTWRTMTMPPHVKFAEAFWTTTLPSLRTTPFSALREAMGPARIDVVHEAMRIYARDFDRELLLVDNYIPLPTLLLRRADFLDLGGFDAGFDLFEDWDFLIRLSQRGEFVHVPRITCEIRHIKGGGSIVME